MTVTSTRRIIANFSGDVVAQMDENAANNSSSPGEIEIITLGTGNNAIVPPTGSVACTIIPPSGNTSIITLKGVNGDTGVPLHLTDPTSFGINTGATFVLNAVTQVTVRIIWS